MKCFWKAHCVGDIEGGIALYQLGRLFEKNGDNEQAAAAFQQYVADSEANGIIDRDQSSRAFKFMANFFLKKGNLDKAYEYSQKCTEFADTKEEGKALLKEIANRRGHEGSFQIQDQDKSDDMADQSTVDPSRQELEPMNLEFTP